MEANNQTSFEKTFKTHEPTFWQKLLQVYWVNPKSWLLDEFTIQDDVLTFKTKAGNELKGRLEELKVKVQTDKYERCEVFIKKDKQKLHFKEIPYMLEDEEWEELFEILRAVPDTRLTTAAWIATVAKIVLKVGENL